MNAKRLFDFGVSLIFIILFSPFLVVIGVIIKIDSQGPIFYRQTRVGRSGKLFRIHKFRTMFVDHKSSGGFITVGNDIRVTRVGRFLRAYKIDELAQLIDVFIGDMSFVGPRPEVPFYVEKYPSQLKSVVLSQKPGITDWASILYRNESALLALSPDPETEYIENILPKKVECYVDYARNRTFLGDLKIILFTVKAVITG